MSLFTRFNTPASAISDVFRILDELNQSTSPSSTTTTSNKRAFTPNFDIHETDSAFVLEGELPGMDDKSKLSIEFTDDNTLLVRGRVEKSSHRTSSDSESKPAGDNSGSNGTDNTEKQVTKATDKSVGRPSEGIRYWVSERSVGEFQRSFSFPGAVDIDAVKASLEHGILKIVVPKKEVVKGRRIEIS